MTTSCLRLLPAAAAGVLALALLVPAAGARGALAASLTPRALPQVVDQGAFLALAIRNDGDAPRETCHPAQPGWSTMTVTLLRDGTPVQSFASDPVACSTRPKERARVRLAPGESVRAGLFLRRELFRAPGRHEVRIEYPCAGHETLVAASRPFDVLAQSPADLAAKETLARDHAARAARTATKPQGAFVREDLAPAHPGSHVASALHLREALRMLHAGEAGADAELRAVVARAPSGFLPDLGSMLMLEDVLHSPAATERARAAVTPLAREGSQLARALRDAIDDGPVTARR